MVKRCALNMEHTTLKLGILRISGVCVFIYLFYLFLSHISNQSKGAWLWRGDRLIGGKSLHTCWTRLVRSTSPVGQFQFVANGAEHLQDQGARADPSTTESMMWTEASEFEYQANEEGKNLVGLNFVPFSAEFLSLATWMVPSVLIVMEHYSLISLCALCQLNICMSVGITSVISLEDLVAAISKLARKRY